jgi:predicted transcriptional regulator
MTEITEYITNDVKAIDSFDSIAAVQNFFSDLHFSHFPVLEEGVYIGSIAVRILKL